MFFEYYNSLTLCLCYPKSSVFMSEKTTFYDLGMRMCNKNDQKLQEILEISSKLILDASNGQSYGMFTLGPGSSRG